MRGSIQIAPQSLISYEANNSVSVPYLLGLVSESSRLVSQPLVPSLLPINLLDIHAAFQEQLTVIKDLSSLKNLLQLMQDENHEEIKAKLRKPHGYIRRFFSSESWAEWLEDQSALGRVVKLVAHTLEKQSLDAKLFQRLDEKTILQANIEAQQVLDDIYTLFKGYNGVTEYAMTHNVAHRLLTQAASLLMQNALAVRMGASPHHLLLYNLISLPQRVLSAVSFRIKNLGEVNEILTLFTKNLERIGTGFIESIDEAAGRAIINFGEQGKLIIEEAATGMRIVTKEFVGDLVAGSDVVIKNANDEFRTTIDKAAEETRKTLATLPRLTREMAEGAVEGFFYMFIHTLKKLTLGESEYDRLVYKINSRIRDKHPPLEKILDFIYTQNQRSLSSSSKLALYKALIKSVNDLDTLEEDRISMSILIVLTMRQDPDLSSRTMWEQWMSFIGLSDSIETLIDELTDKAKLALTSNDTRLIDHYLREPNPEDKQQKSAPLRSLPISEQQLPPVGTILAMPTEVVPKGYLECNGAEYLRSDYEALYSAIGGRYGEREEDGNIYFRVPDYRGYFLRAWDHGAEVDPDASERLARGDAEVGDVVGSIQSGVLEKHRHEHNSWEPYTIWERDSHDSVFKKRVIKETKTGDFVLSYPANVNAKFIFREESKNVTSTGANETRPKNINVMYVIKACQNNLTAIITSLSDKIERLKADVESRSEEESFNRYEQDALLRQTLNETRENLVQLQSILLNLVIIGGLMLVGGYAVITRYFRRPTAAAGGAASLFGTTSAATVEREDSDANDDETVASSSPGT